MYPGHPTPAPAPPPAPQTLLAGVGGARNGAAHRGVHCAVAGRDFSGAHHSYSGKWRELGTAMRGGAPPGR